MLTAHAHNATSNWRRWRLPLLPHPRPRRHTGRNAARSIRRSPHLPGPIDLLFRRSHDNGDTWEPHEVLRTGVGLEGFGDPSFIIDHDTGTILAFHATGTLAGFFEAVEGWEPPDLVQHVGLSVSDDDGRTWTHRIITEQLKRPGISGIFAASGTGTQVRSGRYKGRLVQPMVLRDHATLRTSCYVLDEPTIEETRRRRGTREDRALHPFEPAAAARV